MYRSIAVSRYRGIAVRGLRAWTSAEDAICFALEGMAAGSTVVCADSRAHSRTPNPRARHRLWRTALA